MFNNTTIFGIKRRRDHRQVLYIENRQDDERHQIICDRKPKNPKGFTK